jgi:hypothetical protein
VQHRRQAQAALRNKPLDLESEIRNVGQLVHAWETCPIKVIIDPGRREITIAVVTAQRPFTGGAPVRAPRQECHKKARVRHKAAAAQPAGATTRPATAPAPAARSPPATEPQDFPVKAQVGLGAACVVARLVMMLVVAALAASAETET